MVKNNMVSVKGKLNREELAKWGKNTLVFLAPALVIFLTAIQQGVPVNQALYSVYLWGINVLIDLLKKVSQGK